MNYDGLTALQLKTLCKERGLRVSGTKNEVIIRLMEDDEGSYPQYQQVQSQQGHIQAPQQIIHIKGRGAGEVLAQTIGSFIIIYGVFRIGMAMFFSIIDEQVFFIESFLAWIIGILYVVGGVFTLLAYRNGMLLTLAVLIVSGSLSIMYHDEWSPLSVGLDGTLPISWSLMCSFFCSVMVGLPLLAGFNDLKPGWPGNGSSEYHQANQIITPPTVQKSAPQKPRDSQNENKTLLQCPYCSAHFNVKSGTSGTAKCPACKKKVIV